MRQMERRCLTSLWVREDCRKRADRVYVASSSLLLVRQSLHHFSLHCTSFWKKKNTYIGLNIYWKPAKWLFSARVMDVWEKEWILCTCFCLFSLSKRISSPGPTAHSVGVRMSSEERSKGKKKSISGFTGHWIILIIFSWTNRLNLASSCVSYSRWIYTCTGYVFNNSAVWWS